MKPISYRCHRFPPQLIQHAIWLYCRFTLSFRDVEDLLAERGLDVSYETVRRWVLKFGHSYARRLRRFRPRPDDRWHLDEMFVKIRGRQLYLWRAVDAEGEVLNFLVQSKRNKAAALKLMRKLLKKQGYVPSSIVTDKLPSYSAALRNLGMSRRHDTGGRKNNRAETLTSRCDDESARCRGSNQPAQRSGFSPSMPPYNHFNTQRHLVSRRSHRLFRSAAIASWRHVTLPT